MRLAEHGRRHRAARRLSVRVTAALLLGWIPSVLIGLVSPSFAGSSPGEVAKQVTVLIEGADQGSGILLLRDRSNYTVLTAWHVLKGNGLGEEIAITTPDGVKHLAINGTVRRIGAADLAVVVFQSNDSYSLARIGSIKSVGLGDKIFVGGFPQASAAVPFVEFRVRSGDVEAISERPIPGGYRLLYTAQTLPGMSGGPVINQSGQVIAVHGQAELAVVGTQQKGIAVKSGTNQGIPILEHLPNLSLAAPIDLPDSLLNTNQAVPFQEPRSSPVPSQKIPAKLPTPALVAPSSRSAPITRRSRPKLRQSWKSGPRLDDDVFETENPTSPKTLQTAPPSPSELNDRPSSLGSQKRSPLRQSWKN